MKVVRQLTALEVSRLTLPGRYAVGGVPGLKLYVKPDGGRSWVLRCRVGVGDRDIGLGGFPEVSLAKAREAAARTRQRIREGHDPVADRKAARAHKVTFGAAAEECVAALTPKWRNAKHAAQWSSTLSTYCAGLWARPVASIERQDVAGVLTPIWTAKHETATRLRARIEAVLAYAMQRGYRPEEPNPARWKHNLDAVFPTGRNVARVEHHPALPHAEVRAFLARLRDKPGIGARALEFAILTAARSGEVRGATWAEIDLDAALWALPAARMKAGREHRVPLSDAALRLLRALPRVEGETLVFPGARAGKPLSDMTLLKVCRDLGVDATPHGFRSSFRDWAADVARAPREVAEAALAHVVGSATERAYRRTDLLDQRRELMTEWLAYIAAPSGSNVVRLTGKM